MCARATASLFLAGALLSESAAQGQGKKGGDLLPCSAKFRIAVADVFQADPILGPDATYTHADNGQISVGKLQGRVRIDTTKFNPTGAKMNVQATVCQARCTGTLFPTRLVDVLFQTHTEYATNPVSGVLESTGAVLDLQSMNLNEIAYTRLWVDVPGSGGKSFKLAFSNQTEGAFCCNCVDGKPAKVTCLEENSSGACRKWSIEGEKACLYEFSKGGGPVVEHGLFSAPFKIESLTLLP